MAIYNEILVGRYAKTLQRIFGMKGEVPTKQLSGEVMAMLQFFYGNENRFLEGWSEYGIGFSTGAVAAQFSFQQLRNPASSGVLAVVKRVGFGETTADVPNLSFTKLATADAGITVVNSLDTRVKGTSSLVFSSGTQGANPAFGNTANSNTLAIVALGANQFFDFLADAVQELVLMPGVTLRATGQTANQQINAIWQWRERALEESELL